MDAETNYNKKHQGQFRKIRPIDHNYHIEHGLMNKILETSGGSSEPPYHQRASAHQRLPKMFRDSNCILKTELHFPMLQLCIVCLGSAFGLAMTIFVYKILKSLTSKVEQKLVFVIYYRPFVITRTKVNVS